MALSFLYLAFVRVLQLVRLMRRKDEQLAIEVLMLRVGAENPIRPGQAASRYSWMRPKTLSFRRSRRGPGSLAGGGSSIASGAG